MKIGIIGAGQIGGTLAKAWAHAGHQVMVSNSGNLSKLEPLVAEMGVNGSSGQADEVVEFADVILFSVLWRKMEQVLNGLGSLEGKIVIDTMNPLTTTETIVGTAPGEHIFEIPEAGSTSEELQNRLVGARIVKAFNHFPAELLVKATQESDTNKLTVFLCGDDKQAKHLVVQLIEDSGFIPVDAGRLSSAHLLENLARLWHEVMEANELKDFAFSITRLK
jgi:hypothetical protein